MSKKDDKKNLSIDEELDAFLTSKNKKVEPETGDIKPKKEKKVKEEKLVEDPVETVEETVETVSEPEVKKPEVKEEKKDFMSSLVEDERPESFQEEEVSRVTKKPFKLSRNMIIGGVVALVAVVVAAYFLFFAPNVTMPDFEGQTTAEVQTWMRQNSISSTDVIVVEEYNFDYAAGEVISQSIPANKRFRKGAKITITVSKGADPEEAILFPDMKSMTYSELVAWRDENKLLNMRINQVYNDTVEAGMIISYTLGNNIAESEFKRGTSLTVEVSRGKEPVQTVTVQDFTGKTQAEAQTWADTNKLKLEVKDSFTSDNEKAGKIASQSPSSGSVEQGSTITISVYKHAATMANLVGGTRTDAQSWCSANGVNCNFIEQYHDTVRPNLIVSQSVAAGKIVDGNATVNVYASIGRVDLLTFSPEGMNITDLRSWVEDKNVKLAGLNLVEHPINSASDSQDSGAMKCLVNTGYKDSGTDASPAGTLIKACYFEDYNNVGYLKYGAVIHAYFKGTSTAGTTP